MPFYRKLALAATGIALLFAGAFGAMILADRDNSSTSRTAHAQTIMEPRGIHVEGEGQVTVVPDVAQVIVGVELVGTDLDSLREDANGRMNAVIDRLQEDFDIPDGDIRTVTYDIWVDDNDVPPHPPVVDEPATDDEDTTDEPVEVDPEETRYVLIQLVQVRVTDIDRAGEVIDAALDAGANRIGNISFEIDDRAAAIEQARAQAVENARAKAEHLAELTGVNIGAPLWIDESSPSLPPVGMDEYAMDAEMAVEEMAPRIEPGESVISVYVNIIYEIN